MLGWLFGKKKEAIEERFVNLHNSLDSSFKNIKNDMSDVSKWLSHFREKHSDHNQKFDVINYRVERIEEAIEGMQDVWTRVQTAVQTGGLSKQAQTDSRPNSRPKVSKQVETLEVLRNLTMMERAVVWALLNTDLKLSYEDLSVALGKDKSTLRGQINSLKTKSDSLIEEHTENDGKKRFFISEKKKSEILRGIGKNKKKIAKKVKSER